MTTSKNEEVNPKEKPVAAIEQMGNNFAELLAEEIDMAGGPFEEGEEFEGAIGRTMYDTPVSKDNTVTVLLPPDRIAKIPAQSLVRIKVVQ